MFYAQQTSLEKAANLRVTAVAEIRDDGGCKFGGGDNKEKYLDL